MKRRNFLKNSLLAASTASLFPLTSRANPIYLSENNVTAGNISDALANIRSVNGENTRRPVVLPAGEYTLTEPIILPDDLRGFGNGDAEPPISNFSNPGGATWHLQGASSTSASLTTLKQEHSGWMMVQENDDKGGIRTSPFIGGLTLLGTPEAEGAIRCKGWRSGLISSVAIRGYPNGTAIFVDGNQSGGSWYNEFTKLEIGSLQENPDLWVRYGVVLSGNNAGSGKTNENIVSKSAFLNCTRYAVQVTGQGERNEEQNGVDGGAAYNRILNNTFYAEQALFAGWTGSDDNPRHIFRPIAIFHDSEGGILCSGNYIERVHYPIVQSKYVNDGRFNWDHGIIKASGAYFRPIEEADGTKTHRARYGWRAVRFGSGTFQGHLGRNDWSRNNVAVGMSFECDLSGNCQ